MVYTQISNRATEYGQCFIDSFHSSYTFKLDHHCISCNVDVPGRLGICVWLFWYLLPFLSIFDFSIMVCLRLVISYNNVFVGFHMNAFDHVRVDCSRVKIKQLYRQTKVQIIVRDDSARKQGYIILEAIYNFGQYSGCLIFAHELVFKLFKWLLRSFMLGSNK